MSIRVADDFLRRADEARDFPNRYPVLKQPSDAGVLEYVRRDIVIQARKLSRPIPALALLQYQSAGVFDGTRNGHSTPALEVRQKPIGDRRRHATLVGVNFTFAAGRYLTP
jgi:hypothetical protein